ncbi:MAG: hypothetical protein ACLUYV_00005, partial [Alistipes shahii]
MNGATGAVMLFMAAYLAACIAMGIAVSTLFRYRENSLLLLLWTPIPVLMLGGVSCPQPGHSRLAVPALGRLSSRAATASTAAHPASRRWGPTIPEGLRRDQVAFPSSSPSSTAGWPASAFTSDR